MDSLPLRIPLMGISDPLRVTYRERQDTFLLCRGRETFYEPDTRYLIEFESADEAVQYALDNIGEYPQMDDALKAILNRPKNREIVAFARDAAKKDYHLDSSGLKKLIYGNFEYKTFQERTYEIQVIADVVIADRDSHDPLGGLPLFETKGAKE